VSIMDRMSTWKVLLVDDEPDNLGVAQQILQHFGAEVHTARNGIEALEVLEKVQPTFVVADLSMPEMDGWQLLSSIRANVKWASIPVIALTAHAMMGDREKALQAGFDQYITKPFRLQNFLQDLEACLGRMGMIAA
jgi:two-component system, cell cycle response regulator DivK